MIALAQNYESLFAESYFLDDHDDTNINIIFVLSQARVKTPVSYHRKSSVTLKGTMVTTDTFSRERSLWL